MPEGQILVQRQTERVSSGSLIPQRSVFHDLLCVYGIQEICINIFLTVNMKIVFYLFPSGPIPHASSHCAARCSSRHGLVDARNAHGTLPS